MINGPLQWQNNSFSIYNQMIIVLAGFGLYGFTHCLYCIHVYCDSLSQAVDLFLLFYFFYFYTLCEQ